MTGSNGLESEKGRKKSLGTVPLTGKMFKNSSVFLIPVGLEGHGAWLARSRVKWRQCGHACWVIGCTVVEKMVTRWGYREQWGGGTMMAPDTVWMKILTGRPSNLNLLRGMCAVHVQFVHPRFQRCAEQLLLLLCRACSSPPPPTPSQFNFIDKPADILRVFWSFELLLNLKHGYWPWEFVRQVLQKYFPIKQTWSVY